MGNGILVFSLFPQSTFCLIQNSFHVSRMLSSSTLDKSYRAVSRTRELSSPRAVYTGVGRLTVSQKEKAFV
jgi:hypothetical protein